MYTVNRLLGFNNEIPQLAGFRLLVLVIPMHMTLFLKLDKTPVPLTYIQHSSGVFE